MLPDLAAEIRSRPARGATRITAIDGPSGSGKSTLAEAIAAELGGQVVHTDDFANWENPIDWWPVLLAKVLEPLARGDAARFLPTSWGENHNPSPVEIHPGGDVVLEGVSASREAFRPFLSYAIWIETPRELRLRRGLERGGENTLPRWQEWMKAEDAYVEREQPHLHVDRIVPGDAPFAA